MRLAPPMLQDDVPVLPDAIREQFIEGLRAAHAGLRAVAHAARADDRAPSNVEKRIADAWTTLVSIERLAGSRGTVSLASAPARILVVDDSPDMRFLVARTMERLVPQATVETASDAVHALQLLQDAGRGEDLMVISDHDMGPGATGVDLLAEIAARHPASHRILFTGHPAEHFARQDLQAHALLSKGAKDALQRYLGAP